ncbi:MAG: SIS domain-containing protein [DPANN group archaeon]|nr:SIS domain-containing protein [DPANN group archaeon]
MITEIRQELKESADSRGRLTGMAPLIAEAAQAIIACLRDGGKILIAGNGGSASQASHMAGELVGRYLQERKGIPAISLSTDTAVLTAWSNDYSFEQVFERQVEALGKAEDVFLGISTSGDSSNIVRALQKAKEQGMTTIALLGRDGGKAKGLAEKEMIVPLDATPRIQEGHLLIIHILCRLIEEAMA